jgi:hypothetical protein
MQTKKVVVCVLATLISSLVLSHGAGAQNRGQDRGSQETPDGTEQDIDRKKPPRGAQPKDQREQRDQRAPASRAQPKGQPRRATPDNKQQRRAQPKGQPRRATPDNRQQRQALPQRRTYDRKAERRWHEGSRTAQRPIYIPPRWAQNERPHHRNLWQRRYGRVWWCGVECRIALLFGFTVWAVDTVVSHDSGYSFPIWESLEYNATGESSLWESDWGYVEFTPTRTFTRRSGGYTRNCRDFTRVVVRNDGLERRYSGTACRNPQGAWWIAS